MTAALPMVGWSLLHGRFPLVKPYELSFASVEAVDSVLICCTDSAGNVGVGEVVPLPGYTEDSAESVAEDLKKVLPDLVNRDAAECCRRIGERLRYRPLALSAACQALETCRAAPLLPDRFSRPVVGAFSSDRDRVSVLGAIETLRQAGYTTLKWKVGRQPDIDASLAPAVLATVAQAGLRLRIDANQAFTPEQARRFIDACDSGDAGCVELLEQPFGTDEDGWFDHETLLQSGSPLPLMLDESILAADDVERAARIGAAWIKLKLIKHEGIAGVVDLARRAQALGLKVVLGNGVSTEIGNLYEALAAARAGDAVQGALECNGFARLALRPTSFPVVIERGCMSWSGPAGGDIAFHLDRGRYDELAAAGHQFNQP